MIVDPRGEHGGDVIVDSLDGLLSLFEGSPPTGTIVYRDLHDAEDYTNYLFEFISAMRGWCVMVDEVDQFCNPYQIPPSFKRLLNYQRHFGVDLILVARRPAAVHRDLSALADNMLLFHTHEPRDIQYIESTTGREFAEAVRQLPLYQYLEYQFPPVGARSPAPLAAAGTEDAPEVEAPVEALEPDTADE